MDKHDCHTNISAHSRKKIKELRVGNHNSNFRPIRFLKIIAQIVKRREKIANIERDKQGNETVIVE